MSAPDQPERPRRGLRGLWGRALAIEWVRLMALLAWIAVLISTYASLDGVVGSETVTLLGLVTLKTVPLLLTVMVGLPNVMLQIIARMVL
ncbi:MAG TPA: hypothetical protein VIK91_23505, partial [Nannocystis sp.]